MSKRAAPESIPLSYLNAIEYCPRRFYYEFVEGEMLVNEFVLEGTLLHQKADQPGQHTTEEGEIKINHLYLYSEVLRLSGFADIVEEQEGVMIPVEYKHGKEGKWLNDHIQLCAQALCLEERHAGQTAYTLWIYLLLRLAQAHPGRFHAGPSSKNNSSDQPCPSNSYSCYPTATA